MSGSSIVGTLLRANAALIAVVPVARIKNGVIPIGTALPAISIQEVDAVETRTVRMTETPLTRSRVQVTVQTKDVPGVISGYQQQKEVLNLVRKALPHTRGTVGSYSVDSILPDSAGPDMQEVEAGIYMQSRDFLVTFVAA